MEHGGWIGVDLDGTLAYYDGWKGIEHIGRPISLMVRRVKEWLDQGKEVRIMTARVSAPDTRLVEDVVAHIDKWCLEHIGQVLPITHCKDFGMIELWDDRAVAVEKNTGVKLSPYLQS